MAEVGGSSIPRDKTTTRVKKSVVLLKEQGITESPMHGIYRLASLDNSSHSLPTLTDGPNEIVDVAEEGDSWEEEVDERIDSDIELGKGTQVVYAFYLPSYRRVSEAEGNIRWPIKVGMTTTSVAARMASHRTALPEGPRLALVARTENAALLEKVIHGILTLQGHRSDESAGAEWFLTYPDELAAMCNFVLELPVDSVRSTDVC